MRSFKEYLIETKEEAKYCFKIKIAGDLPEHCEEAMESALKKYSIAKFTKTKTTPIQSKLKDFPTMENAEVHLFDVDLEYPTTSAVLTNYVAENTGISADRIKVRSLKEEEEAELNSENSEKETGKALLTQDYDKENNQNIVGEKHVSSFLKDIARARKESEPQQYKGVNDAILAKKAPKEKSPEQLKPAATAKSPLSAVSNVDPRKGK